MRRLIQVALTIGQASKVPNLNKINFMEMP
jgi:hypothetical protein